MTSSIRLGALVLVSAALVFSSQPTLAQQFKQQGPKLVGTGVVYPADQGFSVAISADGNTAIVGGPSDNSGAGATWVYTRSGGVWTQQGGKLVGTDAVGTAYQGDSVALSADGNTAIVGGLDDNSKTGAAWVFTRSGGVWTQQGGKLVGTGAVPTPFLGVGQGSSVALSANGKTAIVGGWADNGQIGAAWVYQRLAVTCGNYICYTWHQVGSKLVGTGASGTSSQGDSVALSSDGNTAIVGGSADNSNTGAAWVFTYGGGVWTQQGGKLVGTDAVGAALQGLSVALSADGNTAIVGGSPDNYGTGAAWVWTRSGGVWTQQGNKLVGTNTAGQTHQGQSVAVSGDGNTAVVGGHTDNYGTGAAWVFTRSGGMWSQQGGKLVGTDAVGTAYQGQSVALSADGNTIIVGGKGDNAHTGAVWVFVKQATHDFNGDGMSDMLWRYGPTGADYMNLMNGATVTTSAALGGDTNWTIAETGDFNGDGKWDILWRHSSGVVFMNLMNGATVTTSASIGGDPNWTIVETGDFDGDGKSDILWRHSSGAVFMTLMNGATVTTSAAMGGDLNWTVIR